MENLKLLKTRFHRPINIVLIGDKICMAIRTGRDNFEPDLRAIRSWAKGQIDFTKTRSAASFVSSRSCG